ncbi:MvdC/MvdD family ATP grasp protein [Rhizohabitans arisaemae]|uniref:MvdC/MvdD family ATP grasp protein n=1 Tax=Rhizohabitans arisaemae TaxID=2720610 RepID=UPI0024B1771D|nr:hypothetical protein [Rhizohabitans arisaemae]
MILILSSEDDRSVDLVLRKLLERGIEVYRWDPGDFPVSARMTSRLVGGAWRHTLVTADAEIDSADVSAVWIRRPRDPRAASDTMDPGYRRYVERIGRIFLDGWEDTFETRWFPARLGVLIRTQSKLVNLAAAAKLGFTVPDTTVTNDPEGLAVAWSEAGGRLMAKEVEALPYNFDGFGNAFYTTAVTRRHLTSRHRLVHAPVILQPRVDKAVELRINVVGDQVFTAEIHSQGSRATLDDFRHYEGTFTEYGVYDLPKDLERRCVELVRSLGLDFGCIDMILTPEGEYVYLELNPNGQWGWVEEVTGLPISEAIAERLAADERPAVQGVPA